LNAAPKTRIARLRFVADALGVPIPESLRSDLLGGDGAPAQAVLRFCIENGANLDFSYLGDVRPLLREIAAHRKQERNAA